MGTMVYYIEYTHVFPSFKTSLLPKMKMSDGQIPPNSLTYPFTHNHRNTASSLQFNSVLYSQQSWICPVNQLQVLHLFYWKVCRYPHYGSPVSDQVKNQRNRWSTCNRSTWQIQNCSSDSVAAKCYLFLVYLFIMCLFHPILSQP